MGSAYGTITSVDNAFTLQGDPDSFIGEAWNAGLSVRAMVGYGLAAVITTFILPSK